MRNHKDSLWQAVMSSLENGYNSHGVWSTLGEIYELETERQNPTFNAVPDDFIKKHMQSPAIWVTPDPFQTLRYAVWASDWELSNLELRTKYPDDLKEIQERPIRTAGCIVVAQDGDNGYLMVWVDVPISEQDASQVASASTTFLLEQSLCSLSLKRGTKGVLV